MIGSARRPSAIVLCLLLTACSSPQASLLSVDGGSSSESPLILGQTLHVLSFTASSGKTIRLRLSAPPDQRIEPVTRRASTGESPQVAVARQWLADAGENLERERYLYYDGPDGFSFVEEWNREEFMTAKNQTHPARDDRPAGGEVVLAEPIQIHALAFRRVLAYYNPASTDAAYAQGRSSELGTHCALPVPGTDTVLYFHAFREAGHNTCADVRSMVGFSLEEAEDAEESEE